ncbi:hypothetical protein [Plasticicumulans lactativorans]|nr:hypothetical protein [Plasticicumulans lactativorans]
MERVITCAPASICRLAAEHQGEASIAWGVEALEMRCRKVP